jgi:hypothetical protein
LKKRERILKSRLSPENLGNNSPPPRILMDLTKNKACDRIKTASD